MIEYMPDPCLTPDQKKLSNFVVAFHKQMSKDPSDNKRLLKISRQIKKKAADIENEYLRRIEHCN